MLAKMKMATRYCSQREPKKPNVYDEHVAWTTMHIRSGKRCGEGKENEVMGREGAVSKLTSAMDVR